MREYFTPVASRAGDSISPDLVVKSVDRNIDLTTQLVKVNYRISLENTGKAATKNFLFSLDPNLKEKVGELHSTWYFTFLQVAFIGATSGTSEKTYLRVVATSVAGKAGAFWKVDLKTALAGGAATLVSVEVKGHE